ncbi:MAG: hypothetical protein GY710_16500 [Desulfobacteraceae bacterium]|nr:hypothetical protein [Desulfobacteraceae bacterium]
MAHRMGVKEKGNFWGNIIMEAGLPFYTLIGLFIDFSKDIQSFNIILIFMFSGVVGFYIFRNIKYQKERRQLKPDLNTAVCMDAKEQYLPRIGTRRPERMR